LTKKVVKKFLVLKILVKSRLAIVLASMNILMYDDTNAMEIGEKI